MKPSATIAAVGLLALSLAGCGFIGEQLLEEGAEQLTGGEVNIEEDGISVESDEGSFSANDEGELNFESGDESFQMGADMPEDFPSGIPLPDGELMSGTRMESPDGMAWSVQYQYDSGNPSEVLQAQVDALLDAGFAPPEGSEEGFSMTDEQGAGMSAALLEGDKYSINVGAIGEQDDFILTYQVFENQPEQ